jgi:hypothetical protein
LVADGVTMESTGEWASGAGGMAASAAPGLLGRYLLRC